MDLLENRKQRNIAIRIISAIFWLLLTIFIGNLIVGGVIGGMAGSEVGAGKSMADAYNAGAVAGQQSVIKFMSDHGSKIFMLELIIWLVLSYTGKYPWVSKFKK